MTCSTKYAPDDLPLPAGNSRVALNTLGDVAGRQGDRLRHKVLFRQCLALSQPQGALGASAAVYPTRLARHPGNLHAGRRPTRCQAVPQAQCEMRSVPVLDMWPFRLWRLVPRWECAGRPAELPSRRSYSVQVAP